MENHKILPDEFNTRKYSPLDWNDGEENIRQELIVLHTKGERSYWRGQETFEERLDRKILPCARRGMHRDETKRTQYRKVFYIERYAMFLVTLGGGACDACTYKRNFVLLPNPIPNELEKHTPDKNQEHSNHIPTTAYAYNCHFVHAMARWHYK